MSSMVWLAAGWSTKLMRSIFLERSKPRYSARQGVPAGTGLTALALQGPGATEEFLKLPTASEKKPTVLRPPRFCALLATMAPRPKLLLLGSGSALGS